MTKAEQLALKVKEADYVLIGIGQEFNEKFEHIGMHKKLMDALDVIDQDESLNWAIPFLEKAYLDEDTMNENLEAYKKIAELVKDKNYYVITTCIDGVIERAGFDSDRIVQPCGNYRYLHCSDKCDLELIDSTKIAETISRSIIDKDKKIEQPVCPKCGKPLVFNHVMQQNYLEEGYLSKWESYTKWLSCTLNRKLCILELGVGMDFPTVIRFPFEKIGFFNMKASFFRVNETLFQLNEELAEKGVSIEGNARSFILNEL